MPRIRPLERDLAVKLGHRLQRLRVEVGLSQERVAQLAGISRNHYQLMERGLSDRKKNTPSNPTLTTLIDIAAALDIPLDELLGDFIASREGTVVALPGAARTKAQSPIRTAARGAASSGARTRPKKS